MVTERGTFNYSDYGSCVVNPSPLGRWDIVPPRVQTFILHALATNQEFNATEIASREPASLRRAFVARLSILFDMLHLVRPQSNQPKHSALSIVASRIPKSKFLELLAGLGHSDTKHTGASPPAPPSHLWRWQHTLV